MKGKIIVLVGQLETFADEEGLWWRWVWCTSDRRFRFACPQRDLAGDALADGQEGEFLAAARVHIEDCV